MLIRAVRAYAFGPLVDETLTFADGMTVVCGPNESAKSSWHAAIYAALCGRRRGRAPSAEERRFADLHRPWDSRDWVVAAEVELDDGRRLEVRQDLSGKVDCDVRDLDLGRDCSAEFLADGMPDVTRWLGLDRHSFLATAFVAQAQVLAVYAAAGGLQQQLQRAAATAGADHTAASALDRIDAFRRERVGSDRAPTRPLRRAETALRQARAALDNARDNHAAYENALIDEAAMAAAAAEADRSLRRHEAVAMTEAALALQAAAEEAMALYARLGETAPSSDMSDAAVAQDVAAALAAWDAWSDERATMPSTIGSFPARPRPDEAAGTAGVRDAGASDQHPTGQARTGQAPTGQPPTDQDLTDQDPTGQDPTGQAPDEGITAEDLWELAGALEGAPRPIAPAIDERVTAARARLGRAERVRLRGQRLVVAASVSGLMAAALLALGTTSLGPGVFGSVDLGLVGLGVRVAGIAAIGCALLFGTFGLRALRSGGDVFAARAEIEAASLAAGAAADSERAALARRESAVIRVARLGLPADPAALRERARWRAGRLALQDRDREWLGAIEQARGRAAERIRSVARRCDVTASSTEEAVPMLRRWQAERDARVSALEEARPGWARLESLLHGGNVADLQREAAQADATARRARSAFSADELASVAGASEAALAELRARARAADKKASVAEGSRKALAAHLFGSSSPAGGAPTTDIGEGRAAGVAGAEEELVRAEADLQRLRELDATLELTRRFLAVAQERAHRTMAPVLVDAIRARLPELTGGRYTEVTVDPENLRVQVRGPLGRWRDADALSRGTAEQIYLLLRIALAQHLARPGTTCPLVLDEVTVHADAQRMTQILEQLLSASRDRQIILFTQQDQVRDWARGRLEGPRHALRELQTVTTV